MLEMKVYREISAYEAKVMFGLSWRQLGALAIGIPLAGGLFAAIAYTLHQSGSTWEAATDTAMWVIFPVLIPVAAWGWWRPKGLKPERFVGYLLQHYLNGKVIRYDDTYRTEAQPLPGSRPGAPADQAPGAGRAARRKARRRRTARPGEHARTPRKRKERAEARRAARPPRRASRR
ncbi:PrgI family protein [Actinomyces sp. 594]|nr:PrgI family protein [Actinomyces sp. 594]